MTIYELYGQQAEELEACRSELRNLVALIDAVKQGAADIEDFDFRADGGWSYVPGKAVNGQEVTIPQRGNLNNDTPGDDNA